MKEITFDRCELIEEIFYNLSRYEDKNCNFCLNKIDVQLHTIFFFHNVAYQWIGIIKYYESSHILLCDGVLYKRLKLK